MAGGTGTGTPSMSDARRVLGSVFGFEGFGPGQLCFRVPALVMDGLTVEVSPLVALMQDQVAALRLAGVATDGIHSGNAQEDNAAAWRRAAAGETRAADLGRPDIEGTRAEETMIRADAVFVGRAVRGATPRHYRRGARKRPKSPSAACRRVASAVVTGRKSGLAASRAKGFAKKNVGASVMTRC